MATTYTGGKNSQQESKPLNGQTKINISPVSLSASQTVKPISSKPKKTKSPYFLTAKETLQNFRNIHSITYFLLFREALIKIIHFYYLMLIKTVRKDLPLFVKWKEVIIVLFVVKIFKLIIFKEHKKRVKRVRKIKLVGRGLEKLESIKKDTWWLSSFRTNGPTMPTSNKYVFNGPYSQTPLNLWACA